MGQSDFIFLFGINSVKEKLGTSPREVLEIIISKENRSGALRSLEEEAQRLGLPIRRMESQALSHLVSGERHQGIAAKIAAYAYSDFSALLRDLSASSAPRVIMILDNVTDPRNFGALLRCAEAAGVGHVLIPKDRSV